MTDHTNSLPLNIPVLSTAVTKLMRALTPNPSRTNRPYLIEHPDREMAEGRGGMMTCRACGIWRSYSSFGVTPGTAEGMAIFAAHSHNASRHPRRWLRSQQFQASIPVEVRERAEA